MSLCCQQRSRALYRESMVEQVGSAQTRSSPSVALDGRGMRPGFVPFTAPRAIPLGYYVTERRMVSWGAQSGPERATIAERILSATAGGSSPTSEHFLRMRSRRLFLNSPRSKQ